MLDFYHMEICISLRKFDLFDFEYFPPKFVRKTILYLKWELHASISKYEQMLKEEGKSVIVKNHACGLFL